MRLPRSKEDRLSDLHNPATIINHLTYKDSLDNERFTHSESLLLDDYFVVLSFEVHDLLHKHNEVLLIDVLNPFASSERLGLISQKAPI